MLTGLSGSGETLLACAYARALDGEHAERQRANLLVVPVQPGWHDPTPLLGYLNPLRGALMVALEPARLHFGWRVVDDVLAFPARLRQSETLAPAMALDEIVYGKILPKLRGDDSRRFRAALEGCRQALEAHDCPRSAGKVEDLLQDLVETGSARFWR